MWHCPLSDVATRDPGAPQVRCGAKAAALQRLIAAGLPVPPGFVILDDVFRETTAGALPEATTLDALGHALEERARAALTFDEATLGHAAKEIDAAAKALAGAGTLAVRSSMSLEDGAGGGAAGIFASQLDVTPAELWPAIRAVWASAYTPLAAAYARRRAAVTKSSAPIAVAVIVQRFIPGERVTVYTRRPGAPSEERGWVERRGERYLLERNGEPAADVPSATRAAWELALRAEAALALSVSGADVELIEGPHASLALVQARPIIHPSYTAKLPAPPLLTAALVADGRTWYADLAHNPDPLSPAQQGLVELVDAAQASPYASRVCGGYLYFTPRGDSPAPAIALDAIEEHVATIEARAAAALGEATADDLGATVEAYLRLVRVWAHELSPLVAAIRRTAGTAPTGAGVRPSAVEARLLACARGELEEHELMEQIGDLAAAWDVAAPTLAEAPERIAEALARLRQRPAAAGASGATNPWAAIAAELAERDDLWFARAQARVRRAMLALGQRLGLGDDIFWIPFALALSADRGEPFDLDRARARASAARAAHRRSAAWRMPPVVGGSQPPAPPRWHGVGGGGVAIGRAKHVPELWRLWEQPLLPVGAAATVIVTPAVTPALAVAAAGAVAIVSETGGLLDHGAAMARELGIPCVVGCTDAMSLPANSLIEVDGDSGAVRVLQAELTTKR